jgi:hypothetical protein
MLEVLLGGAIARQTIPGIRRTRHKQSWLVRSARACSGPLLAFGSVLTVKYALRAWSIMFQNDLFMIAGLLHSHPLSPGDGIACGFAGAEW